MGDKSGDELPIEAAVADFYDIVPRLIVVSGRAGNSYALWRGLNRVMFSDDINNFDRDIAAGFREDCIHASTIRLYALLDANSRMVSFQRVYRHVIRPEVAEAVVVQKCEMYDHPQTEMRARSALTRFLSIYIPIFDTDLHGNLAQFRHRGVAHLTEQDIERRVSYDEIGRLAHSVVGMSQALKTFAPDTLSIVRDEADIEDIAARSETVWMRLVQANISNPPST